MKPYAVNDTVGTLPLENIELGGYVSALMETFFEERIYSDFAKNEIYQETEDAFRDQSDDATVVGYWKGEFWGKWIISAVRVCRYKKDRKLKEFLHGAALKLLSYQREDGYVGTYKNSKNFISPDPEETKRSIGWECNWNWNIWCRKYTLWGLLECYELTKDKRILDGIIRFADHLVNEIEESGYKLSDTGTFNGLPSCSILKPMLILYRITEDEKYLSFCQKFVDDWDNTERMPAIVANSLSGKPLREWYPLSDKWAKAYEMMSCFDGLAELYRVTGNEKYLKACEAFYDILINHERNIIYSVAFNDVFGNAAYDVNAISEPCDIIHFIRLCHELYKITGKAKYMDSIELAFYNAFLASSFKDGKWGSRGTRSACRHLSSINQAGMKHSHCCVNNMPRGYMNMTESCIMQTENELVINLYNELKYEDLTTKIYINDGFLTSCGVRITVCQDENSKKPIKLRIPSWSKKTTVTVGNESYYPASGYFTVAVVGAVTEINIAFDDSVEIIPLHPNEKGDGEWKLDRWRSGYLKRTQAFAEDFIRKPVHIMRRGAILLCRSKFIGSTDEEMFSENRELISDGAVAIATPTPAAEGINAELDLTITDGCKTKSLTVCDFASGSNILSDDPHLFSIYF